MYLLRRTSLSASILTKFAQNTSINSQNRQIKRWVAPTLRELRKRANKMELDKEIQPRSGFLEWNYRSELYAFGKRLHEEFELPLLQTAFTQRSYIIQEQQKQQKLGIEEADSEMSDNEKLSERGFHLAKEYVSAFIQHSLPKLPVEGQKAVGEYLLGAESLAHIASHLGMKDLIFAAEYPPSQESLAQSMLAVIGALADSSGVERTFLFIRDFICTQLNQRDLLELWQIEDPESLLKHTCIERKMGEPEARLIGDCGKNSLLAAYNVGLYVDKKMIGKGFGEDIPTAVKTASLDALQTMFAIPDNMRPFDFQIQVQPKSVNTKLK